MESIEKHIETDESILQDPLISKQQRRHVEQELRELKVYQSNHPDDHHDPSPLELFCEMEPDADECRIYEDWYGKILYLL